MREIKFRAWDKIQKKFVDDFFIDRYGDIYGLRTLPNSNSSDTQNFIDINLMLMQYTGLKDKNGVEIYEGDIVRTHSHKPTNFKIEFIEGGFCATQNGIKYPIDINHFYTSIGCTIEVICNIYENPELLEQIKCGS